jgi:hypothetical protein
MSQASCGPLACPQFILGLPVLPVLDSPSLSLISRPIKGSIPRNFAIEIKQTLFDTLEYEDI